MQVMQRNRYGLGLTVAKPFAEAVAAVKDALKQEGFGVLTEIDVQRTMKEKRGADFPPYVILGACNPVLAEQALRAEPDLGLLLPCNVVVYENEGSCVVEAMDPLPVLGMVQNPALEPIAQEARTRLERALSTL